MYLTIKNVLIFIIKIIKITFIIISEISMSPTFMGETFTPIYITQWVVVKLRQHLYDCILFIGYCYVGVDLC